MQACDKLTLIDIAPLMATLLGVNFPVNSVGVLPDIEPMSGGYLAPKEEEKTKAEAGFVNALVCRGARCTCVRLVY